MSDLIEVHQFMRGLSTQRPIFHLEADFQFALGWHIRQLTPDCELRFEYRPLPNEAVYVDIWIPSQGTILELKYLTEKLELECDSERFILNRQSAHPLRRYDFVRDIARIEHIVDLNNSIRNGFAILLTNDSYYWRPPTSDWETNMDADFRLHEDRSLTGDLSWSANANDNTIKGRKAKVQLKGSYNLHWENYSDFGNKRGEQFRYLPVSVDG